ncbi:MAG: hypothetical protein LWX55_02585 [Deltaproteobacteria bacterium]|nr:hypothetical protein [Deltaproteobacteria bacterium]
MGKKRITAMLTLVLGVLLLKVTAGYAAPCTSALANIDPTSVSINTEDQAFSYYIEPTISAGDSGIDKIEIVVPAAYSNVKVMDVLVAGVRVSHSDNTSSNTISLTLEDKVLIDGTDIQINFTAHTPNAVDSGTAFRSTVDDTSYPGSVSCTPGDGDGGGSVATDTWTVRAGYAGPCASAVAEIDPTDVNIKTKDQAFSYYIEPTISSDDSGINKIDIVVPDSYSHVRVTSVSVGGSPAEYDDSDTSANTISVTLDTKVTVDGTDLQVNFTARTPNSPDSGVEFLSTVDDTENPDPVSCSSGDGDGGGSIATNTWTVRAGYLGPCASAVAEIDPTDVNIKTKNQAFSYYIEPTISPDDSGINKIEIVVPAAYSNVTVMDVLVAGVRVSYSDNTSSNTISLTLEDKVIIDGTDIQVNFTAHTPDAVDSGTAFRSTVDDTSYPGSVSCTPGDGDDGGSIATDTWTVRAGYAGPCASAVAEIDPTDVNIKTDDQVFSYYIEPTISIDDSGINKIVIEVPAAYSNVKVMDVLVAGVRVSHSDNTSSNTISLTLEDKVLIDGTDIQINFTAHTPNAVDSGTAFRSTVDDTSYPGSVSCTPGDGDGGGSVATDTWTVRAGYAGPCASAVAEIDPTDVNINTEDQAFAYYIEPTISADDSGINKIEIVVPGSYSDVRVTSVSVGGSPAGYNNNSSDNTISVTLDTKVTVDGTDLRVNFTAHTPNSPDSGVAFTSTVDDTQNPDPVNCTDGSWTVTAGYAGPCTSAVAEIDPTDVNIKTDDQAFSYYIEPTINPDDSGINKIEIVVPGSYSDVRVTSVSVGGSPAGYNNNFSDNTISVTLDAKITVDGTDLRVNFTAHTPNSPDSGVAFTSTVDDTENSDRVSCQSGDGDDGGSIATNTWTVTAGYAGPCTSAVAEIEPTYVNINTDDQAFSYYIRPTINPDDSGVDKIEIRVPDTYSDVKVTGVSVGDDTSSEYDNNSSGNTISVTLRTRVTTNGTELRVNFTADTPYAVDSGVKFTSTVDNTSNSDPVTCTPGDGEGSVSTDTWIVTAPLSDGGNACFIATAASGFTMEPRLKVFGEFCDRILLSNKAARSLVELYYYITGHDNFR